MELDINPETDPELHALYQRLKAVFDTACRAGRKRHDKILKQCVFEAKRQKPHEALSGFAEYLSRKLRKNETVIIGMQVMQALGEKDSSCFRRLESLLRNQSKKLESQAFIRKETGQVLYLVISQHTFRTAEVTRDLWLAYNPDASQIEREQNDYIINCQLLSQNLMGLPALYSPKDLIDVLALIREDGAFFLRALFLFHVGIEPKPFAEDLEKRGYFVSYFLDDSPTNETFAEHDFLKRLRGLLIAKTEAGFQRAVEDHADFLEALCHTIPLPNGRLTSTGQLH